MNARRRGRSGVAALLLVLLLNAAAVARAQQALPDLSLEDLMRMDSGQVFGASERLQPVTEAPAAVSFVTAEEITRYGYRTLADILRGVRGLYITDDRNFSLLGARGFAKPGDYNSRILLLVNGHRVNDNVFGQAEIGAEFGIDPAMFERVEIIRGPASSLYGDSAFFAVINVITKRGASLDGVSLAVDGGNLGTYLTRASAGHQFTSGLDVAVSGTIEGSAGNDKLYFPFYDTPATNNGIADGLDGERTAQFYGQTSFKHFTFTGAYGTRRRDVPTASFGSLFNDHDPRERTTDRHTLADLEYAHAIGVARVAVRASFDRFSYDGIYPRTDGDGGVAVANNNVLGTRWTFGGRVTRPLPAHQLFTVGAEFIDNLKQNQQASIEGAAAPVFYLQRSSTQKALYLQDEIKLTRWLIANGGLRYDKYEDFVRVTPRTAVIVMPSSNQSFKYLYGRAFRAPNAYELNTFYFGEAAMHLGPETIDTHEVVWERYVNDWLRTSVSSYFYQADGLITQVSTTDPTAAFGSTFVNQMHVRANGLELEAQMRLKGTGRGLISYALQRARDSDTGATLVNSPRHLAKMRLSIPGPLNRSFVSLEALYIGSRQTLAADTVGPAVTASLTVVAPLPHSLELVGSFRNLFNAKYLDPASANNEQDVIEQNGRTFRVGVRVKLGGH